MADHHGFIYIGPDGRFLSHGTTDKTCWALSPNLDCAHLFPMDKLGPIQPGEGFEDLADEWDVPLRDVNKYLVPVPARSVQRIEIGFFQD